MQRNVKMPIALSHYQTEKQEYVRGTVGEEGGGAEEMWKTLISGQYQTCKRIVMTQWATPL